MQRIASLARRPSRSACAALLALALAPSAAQAQSWIVRTPMPTPRGALTCQPLGGRIHVIGGALTWGGSGTTNQHDVYDPATGAWSVATPVTDGNCWGAMSAVLGDRIYLLGGWPGGNSHRVYDASSGAWSPIASPGQYSWGHSAVALSGLVYLVGNGSAGGLLSLKSYDPGTNAWTTRALPPSALSGGGLTAVAIGTAIHVVGSGTNHAIYDSTANTWSLGPPLLVSTYAPAAAALGGKLLVFGGRLAAPRSSTTHRSVQLYDPATGSWSLLPDMPTARHECAAAVVGGSAFVFGGFNSSTAVTPGPNEEWQSGLVTTELRWSDAARSA